MAYGTVYGMTNALLRSSRAARIPWVTLREENEAIPCGHLRAQAKT